MPAILSRPPIHDRRRDKALLIGLEYANSPNDQVPRLYGVYDEVRKFEKYLIDVQLYTPENVIVITDEDRMVPAGPKCMYIRRAIVWLLLDAKPGQRRIFYFAGHGYQLEARAGSNELDGRDEAILIDPRYGEPVAEDGSVLNPWTLSPDHSDQKKLQGILVDNTLKQLLVDALPRGVHLYTFWDTCHSGTILGSHLLSPTDDWAIAEFICWQIYHITGVAGDHNFVQIPFSPRQALASANNRSCTPRQTQFLFDVPRCSSPLPMDENMPVSDDRLVVSYSTLLLIDSLLMRSNSITQVSISSSEDYQLTFNAGNGSMIECLMQVLSTLNTRQYTPKTFMLDLEKEMRARREAAFCADFQKMHSRCPNPDEIDKARHVQLPMVRTKHAIEYYYLTPYVGAKRLDSALLIIAVAGPTSSAVEARPPTQTQRSSARAGRGRDTGWNFGRRDIVVGMKGAIGRGAQVQVAFQVLDAACDTIQADVIRWRGVFRVGAVYTHERTPP
ncbi:hypothetical protein NM688_g1882 [Phlebia brevispora]|uniref:Uncharacterized protein n=1 Tax=Phlebia brevispora TaxID=194682 RepID=A0ACC1TA66_9APHY|nr:hypothetical protein NM688_g1882 [Phlebia brevispora]